MIEVYLDSCCKSWGFVELKVKIGIPDFVKKKHLMKYSVRCSVQIYE
jgi:hypothetical protein